MMNKCLTIKELKEFVKDLPEVDDMGSLTEVWLQTGNGLSSPCISILPLNQRQREDGTYYSDILLSYNE